MARNKGAELKQIVIKPLKEQWIMWVILSYSAFIIVFIIGVVISLSTSEIIPWKGIGYFLIFYSVIIILCSIISRLSYKGKLIITENEVIKMHGNKEQFRIKREDILFIGVRKVNIFVKFLVILSAFIGDLCTDIISFRFYKADTIEVRKFGGYLKMNSLTDEETKAGMQEFVECLTYRQALKISNFLKVPIKKVVF